MEMKVLCEGIERREQEVMLIESGCKYGQGFLYKKPVPAEDFFRFLDSCDGEDKN